MLFFNWKVVCTIFEKLKKNDGFWKNDGKNETFDTILYGVSEKKAIAPRSVMKISKNAEN